MKHQQEKILMSGIGLVIIAIIIIVIFSFNQKQKINVIASRLDSTTNVLLRLSDLYSTVIDHAGNARNYALSGDKKSIAAMQRTARFLLLELDSFREQLKNNPAQKAEGDSLAKYVNRKIDLSNQIIALGNEKGLAAASALYQTGLGRYYNNKILLIINHIQHIEMRSLQQDQKNSAASIRNLNYYLLGLLIIILVLTLFIIQKIRLDLLARRKIEDQLKKFNEELEQQVRVKATQIRENEERYRTLAGVYQTTPGGTVLTCNDTFAKMLGYDSNRELVQKNASMFYFSDADRDGFIARLLKKGKLNNLGFKLKSKDGSPVYVIENCSLHNDPVTGEQIIEGVMVDITERKKAEQAVRIGGETQKLIMNSALDAIVCMDTAGTITVWTPRAEMIFGWKEKDVLGKSLADTIIPEQYRKQHTREFQHYLETGEHKVLNRMIEITALNQRGEEFPVELSIIPVKQGDIEFFCSFIRDITERKKAEERIRINEGRLTKAQQIGKLGYWQQELNSNMIWGSEEAKKIYGFPAIAGELASETVAACIPDIVNVRQASIDLIRYNKKYNIEFQINPADGSPMKYISAVAEIEKDEQGMPVRFMGVLKDITERRKAEEKVRESEERYRILVEQASDAIFIKDSQGNLLEVNTRACDILGYTKEQLCQLNVKNLFRPLDLAAKPVMCTELLRGERTSAERNILHKNGSSIPVDITAQMLSDGRIIAIIRDITERKKAEEELKRSQHNYSSLMNTVDGIVWEANAQTFEFNFVSKQAERLLGYPVEQWINEPTFWIEHIHPDDRNWTIDYCVQSTRLMKPHEFEYRMIAADGEIVWLHDIVTVIIDNDRPVKLRGIMVDITERKKTDEALRQSEEKYRSLVEQAVDAIALYDSAGQILDVNTGASLLLGYTKEELSNMTLGSILQPEELLENPVRFDVLQEGKSTVKQRRMKKKDGTIVETEVRSQQLPDGRFLSVVRDLTDRIRKEQELDASYKAIRKLTRHLQNIREEERAHIAREIHDELGQQLTVLKMDVSWLINKITDPDDMISEKMKALINMLDETVKTVRRISSELRPSLLDDLGLMAAMEWQLNEFEKRSDIKTRLTASETEVKLSNTVKTALFRIFQESLTNVARHSGAQKVLVNLKQKDNNFVLSIVDNGKGFDKQKIADKMSLGILGMKERTSMIGGTYEITTSPGKGTAVVVAIPLDMLSQN